MVTKMRRLITLYVNEVLKRKGMQSKRQLDRKDDPQGIEQKIEFGSHNQMVYMQKPETVQENEMHKISRDLEIQTDSLFPARRPDKVFINKKKRTGFLMEFAVTFQRHSENKI